MDEFTDSMQAQVDAIMKSGRSVPLSLVSRLFQKLLVNDDFWLEGRQDLKFRFDIGEHITFDLDASFGQQRNDSDLKIKSNEFEIDATAHVTSSSTNGGTRYLVEKMTVTSRDSISPDIIHSATKFGGVFHRSIRPGYLTTTYCEAVKAEQIDIRRGEEIELDELKVHLTSIGLCAHRNIGPRWQIDLIWHENNAGDPWKIMNDYVGATSLTEGPWGDAYSVKAQIVDSRLQVSVRELRRFPGVIRAPLPNSYSEQCEFAEFLSAPLSWQGGEVWQGYAKRKRTDLKTVVVLTEIFPLLLAAPWGVKGYFANSILEAMTSRLTCVQDGDVSAAHRIAADLIEDFVDSNKTHQELKRLAAVRWTLLQPKQPSRRSRIKELIGQKLQIPLSRSEQDVVDGLRNIYAHEVINDGVHSDTDGAAEAAYEREAALVSVATKAVLAFFGFRKAFYRQKYPSGGDLYKFEGTP